jgi:hypothetical protein
MTFQTATTARLASLAALVLVLPAPASAGIDPGSYHHVDVNHDYGPDGGFAGGFISCPAGTKAVASGATSSGLDGSLKAGLTTFDQNGAFAIGGGRAGEHLQISARCVDAAQVQGSTRAETTVRDHRPPEPPYLYSGRASCPPGTVAYGGGGFFTQPGGPPEGGGTVYASMPDADGTGWFFATAGGILPPDTELWISTHCLPRAEFGEIFTVTATETAPPDDPSSPDHPTVFVAARCPAGFSAYAGGASWHREGSSTPEWMGNLSVSNMTADDRGWFARGWTSAIGGGAQLTATVQCMTPPVRFSGPWCAGCTVGGTVTFD